MKLLCHTNTHSTCMSMIYLSACLLPHPPAFNGIRFQNEFGHSLLAVSMTHLALVRMEFPNFRSCLGQQSEVAPPASSQVRSCPSGFQPCAACSHGRRLGGLSVE